MFEDGPTKTKKRYCVNSASIDFIQRKIIKRFRKFEKNTMENYDVIIIGSGPGVFLQLGHHNLD